jgi:predicted acetyltransferase
MVSNPLSIRSGAGKTLVFHLFQECIEREKEGIIATSLPHSTLFYKKLGFEEGERFSAVFGGDMRITSQKIEQIIKNLRCDPATI